MSYNRLPSPGSRRITQPGRTSAGSFFTPSYHDYAPPSRASRDHAPLPRISGERVDAPRAIPVRQRSPPRRAREDDYVVRPRRMSLDPGDPASRRPLSIMPPRSPNRSTRPIITKDLDRPSSPLSKSARSSGGGVQEVASYVIPASSASGRNHHRHSSLTSGDRLRPLDRDPRERAYVGGSRTSALRPRPDDRDDRDYNYEYTGPKKEFLRDGAPPPLSRPSDRRDSYNSGGVRPTSMIVPDRVEPEYRRLNRDMGPPPSTRGFNNNLGRSESLKHPRRARDDDQDRREPPAREYRDDREAPRYGELGRTSRKPTDDGHIPYPEESTRHNRPRKPTIEEERLDPRSRPRKPTLEEDRLDPKSRDYDDQHLRGGEDRPRRHHDRDHERRKDYDGQDDRDRRARDDPRDRRDRPEEDGGNKGNIAGGAAAAAATAGLAAEGIRRHRHKESKDDDGRSPKDPQAYLREPGLDRDSESTSISGETRLSGGPEDEDKEERRRRRRGEREREEREYHEARDHDRHLKEDPTHTAPKEIEPGPQPGPRDLAPPGVIPPGATIPDPAQALREQKSYERRPSDSTSPRQHRRRRHRRHHSRTRDEDSYSDPSSASSEETEEDDLLPRNPRVVTPSPEEANRPALPPPPPKGILKKAKAAFPEPPNPVREGVAPLDAAKKGIPPEARWTRINRRLVNPEALEQEGVRFEEYPDYVIVLKVLNQEEISRYAQKTHEIREKRRVMMGAEGEVSDRS